MIFLVVTVMLCFDERGKDTDGGNIMVHTSFWTIPNWIGPEWTAKSF